MSMCNFWSIQSVWIHNHRPQGPCHTATRKQQHRQQQQQARRSSSMHGPNSHVTRWGFENLPFFATNWAVLSTIALMSGGGKITPMAFVCVSNFLTCSRSAVETADPEADFACPTATMAPACVGVSATMLACCLHCRRYCKVWRLLQKPHWPFSVPIQPSILQRAQS